MVLEKHNVSLVPKHNIGCPFSLNAVLNHSEALFFAEFVIYKYIIVTWDYI